MTDRPSAWLTDPTGRHDHRYWDGTRWTDHVADAGVAATDPYDEAPDATPGGESVSSAAPDASTTASPSGWASTIEPADADEATSSVSGWGATDEPEAEPTTVEAPASTSPWSSPSTTSWGAPATTSTDDDGSETTSAPLSPAGSYWDRSSSTTTDVGDEATDVDEPTVVTDEPAATWGTSPSAAPSTATWGASTTPTPTSTWGSPGTPGSSTMEPLGAPPATRESRKGLLVAVALGAIVAIVIALVVVRDDEGGGGGGTFAAQFSEQLRSQTQVTEAQADCVGDYVVDEIGASRLSSIRELEDRTAPPELQEDFDQAVQRAFTECEVDQQDLMPPNGSTDGAADSSDGLSTEVTAPSEVLTESQYEEYYRTSLGLSEEDAKCLAEQSAAAEASGEIEQGDGISQFYQWVDECGIDPDELFQTIATADAGTTG